MQEGCAHSVLWFGTLRCIGTLLCLLHCRDELLKRVWPLALTQRVRSLVTDAVGGVGFGGDLHYAGNPMHAHLCMLCCMHGGWDRA